MLARCYGFLALRTATKKNSSTYGEKDYRRRTTMKSEAEIRDRIDKLDERHAEFSMRTRMSTDGLNIIMRMSELQWVLEEK